MTPTLDYGPHPSVRARWRKGSHIRALKRYGEKACLAVVESVASFRAALSLLVSRGGRLPRHLHECSPEQKVVYVALLAGDGRR